MANRIDTDVCIVGGGIGGLMTAYRLLKNIQNIGIVIVDRGRQLTDRACPAQRTGHGCYNCKMCDITNGFAGAGAFSDGKLTLGTSYGGTLAEAIGAETAQQYIGYLDGILKKYALDYPEEYSPNKELYLECLKNDLQLLDMPVRHLGTDNNRTIMGNLLNYLAKECVTMVENNEVSKIYRVKDGYSIFCNGLRGYNDTEINAKYVVVAVGRGGSEFVKNLCDSNGIETMSNPVDIGVRVEMKDDVWKHFSSKIYEPKILYKTKSYEDSTRMFCFNQGGVVSTEKNDDIVTVNGHSYHDKKTDNCNFAILTSIKFTKPFNDPTAYAKHISTLSNLIGNGNVIVQRFGDLIRNRRTTESRLERGTVKPTLKATPGDLSLVLPHRILVDIIETMYALNKVAPGTSNDDTLLYGCESKYYSVRPFMNKDFSIMENLYLVGDGSGICHGLAQSGAMGLYVADKISEDIEETLSNEV